MSPFYWHEHWKEAQSTPSINEMISHSRQLQYRFNWIWSSVHLRADNYRLSLAVVNGNTKDVRTFWLACDWMFQFNEYTKCPQEIPIANVNQCHEAMFVHFTSSFSHVSHGHLFWCRRDVIRQIDIVRSFHIDWVIFEIA